MNRKNSITKQLRKFLKIYKASIEEKLGVEANQRVAARSLQQMNVSYSEIPDIGMAQNQFQQTMDFAFIVHIIYKNLLKEGLETRQIGEIIYYGFKNYIDKYPVLLMKIIKRKQFSKRFIKYMKKQAELSKTRDHIYNWVFDVIDSNGEGFEWGIDYKRCGIYDFFCEKNELEIIPYICATDYCMFAKMKAELYLTKTLGRGDECCNFRYKKDGNCNSDLEKIIDKHV